MTGDVCTCGHDRNAHTETGQWCSGNVGSTGRPKTCACDTYEPPRRAHAMTDHPAIQQQLDRLEEIAQAATPGPWRDTPMGSEGSIVQAGGNDWRTARKPATCREYADATHIALNDPARVLALVAGLREVVSEVRELREMTSPGSEMRAANPLVANAVARSTDRALAAVASVFAGEETSHE